MKKLLPLYFIICVINFAVIFSAKGQNLDFTIIPPQKIDPYKIIGDTARTMKMTMPELRISNLVQYKIYKEYLSAVKTDSSEKFYISQLPDTNIGPVDVHSKYLTGLEYDNFPVLGISWENAMNFCKWKTLKDNPKGSISFIYRLPSCSEWLTAINYFTYYKVANDLNKNYSDWTLNSKDDNYGMKSNDNNFPYDYTYLNKPGDVPVLKRKTVIGSSWLYAQNRSDYFTGFFTSFFYIDPYSYYANQGYRQISFRLVREPLTNIDGKPNNDAIMLMDYWGIHSK